MVIDWTTFSYDLLNRPISVTRPLSDSNPAAQTTTLAYEGRTKRTTDAQGKLTTQLINAIGQPARNIDHDGYSQTLEYDPFGNLSRVTDSLGNTLQTAVYTIHGVMTSQFDADRGTRSFTPNSLGEVVSMTNARGQTTSFSYDAVSRLIRRSNGDGTARWNWGTSATAKNIGKLACINGWDEVSCTIGAGNYYQEGYSYYNDGKLQTTTVSIDGDNYQIDYSYNTLGELDTLTYPVSTPGYRLKLKYEYQNAQVIRVKDFNSPYTVFWQVDATDPRGQPNSETLGNGVQVLRGLDFVTGLPYHIRAGPSASASILNLDYLWDGVGNLTERYDGNQNLTEQFYYDNLYRLDYATLKVGAASPVTNLDVNYNAMGNITSRSDVNGGATWTYGSSRPHAVTLTGTGGTSYHYDADGNMDIRGGSTIVWNKLNLPITIGGSSGSSDFYYDPNLNRYKQAASGSVTETTLYIGGLVERVDTSDPTFRHYIPAGSNTVVYSRTYGGQVRTYYATGDHFGSTTAVTCGLSANPVDSSCTSGSVLVKESFGAFGNRRGSNWTGTPSGGDMTLIGASTRRGFTFHEQVDNLSLIHMNGRVFDPAIGRFLSADPFVPDPDNTQSFNRYSYVSNNPLTFTDPSGFCAPPECGTEVVGGPLYDREPHFIFSGPDYRYGIPLSDPSLLAKTQGDIHLASITGTPRNTVEAGIKNAILRGDVEELRLLLGEANLSVNDLVIAKRALSAMESLGAADARMLAQRYGVDFANRIGHVFGKTTHKLEGLIKQFGSPERAFTQVQSRIDSLSLSAGKFEKIVNVGGTNVTVRGVVQDGLARISTIFIP